MNLNYVLRRLAYVLLPDKLLHALKKLYYPYLLRSLHESREPDLEVVRRLVGAGDSVIDVGANIGVYTVHLSEQVGPSGHVYSIEPFPITCDILNSNVKKLELSNVSVLNLAISDHEGMVYMEVPTSPLGYPNLYRARISALATEVGGVAVQARTLDGLITEIPEKQWALIKCDVEGHELECLKGAPSTVQGIRPAWLIEISTDPDYKGSKASEIFRLLEQQGYGAHWFDGMHLNERRPGDKSVNYWFLLPHHLQKLRESGLSIQQAAPRV